MNTLIRNTSLLTGAPHLETLHTFKQFPVYMGCTDLSIDTDQFADMVWDICHDTGLIQLQKLLPLEILYQFQHNEGIGSVWTAHYQSFCAFLANYTPSNVLEIGGAHGIIAKEFTNTHPEVTWHMVEPNPTIASQEKIYVIPKWFDETFSFNETIDTVVHSHVTEHTYNPIAFFKHIHTFLKIGDRHVFSVPNMQEQLIRHYTNCLNFEHTVFLTENIIDSILRNIGFRIVDKHYFLDHSIFYATEKIAIPNPIPTPNTYTLNRYLFQNFLDYHRDMITSINLQLEKNSDPIFLFGAHIFSQYLIAFGLNTNPIVAVLDNGPQKQGKRLYGTPFEVKSPKILKDIPNAKVILKAGIYNEEIKKDILETINKNVLFIE